MQSAYFPAEHERATAPMPPAYHPQPVGPPPPPPIWALPYRAQVPPPRPPTPRGRAGIWAFLFIVLGTAIAVIAGSPTGQSIVAQITAPNPSADSGIVATVTDSGTATLVPTLTPSATDTPVPTAPPRTTTPAPTVTPAVLAGFQQYNEGNGYWSIQAPLNTKITVTSAKILTIDIPTTRFDIVTDVAFFEYDSPIIVASDQVEGIAMTIVQTTGATDVKLTGTPATVQLGANVWESIPVSAQYKGKKVKTTIYYAPHGNTATILAYSAPDNQFAATEAKTLLPMAKSFVLHQ